MKSSQIKTLIKGIIKEVHGLTKQDRPGVMGAVNVEENAEKVYRISVKDRTGQNRIITAKANSPEHAVQRLENAIKSNAGIFAGMTIVSPEATVTSLPTDTGEHDFKMREQSATGAVGGYSTPFAFKKKSVQEMTATGDVAGYATPYAFSKSKSGSQRALDATTKMGYKKVGDTPRV